MSKIILLLIILIFFNGCIQDTTPKNQNNFSKNSILEAGNSHKQDNIVPTQSLNTKINEQKYQKFIFTKKIESNSTIFHDKDNDLIWERTQPVKHSSTYLKAKKYCSELVINGYVNWRLPTFKEFKSNEENMQEFGVQGSYYTFNNLYFFLDKGYEKGKGDLVLCVHNFSKNTFFKDPFKKISNKVNQDIKKYLSFQPIPPVKQPSLPSVYKLKKDIFETKAMFQKRIEKAKVLREEQTKSILEKYRLEVEKHNKLIEKQKKEILFKQSKIPEMQRKYTIEAFKSIMGSPFLEPLYIESNPQYDAEKGLFYLTLKMKGAKYNKTVEVKVNPGEEARNFFKALITNKYELNVHYRFLNQNELVLDKILVNVNGKIYKGIESKIKNYKAEKTMIIVLKDTKLDKSTLDKKFKLQNPNIKDVEFETYLVHEQKVFNDDIPQLLSKAKQVPIDKSKWLFIIGIENYTQTDNISFSKRSAELFKQVAKKTLGIQERNIYTLIDDGATSASIKDRMKLMLRNVKKGDKIYFYYSGHGIPVLPAREPYILPSDKIPDFVNDDKFFKVKNIYKILADSKASQVIVFMDSCFTGQTDGKSVFGTAKASSRLSPKSVSFDKSKMAIITAGTNNQYSNVYMKRGNRLFSYYLMKSLLEGRKNINTLYKEVSLKVEDASSKMGDMNLQQPVFSGNKNLKL